MIFTGKTLDEAFAAAEKEMGYSRSELLYEIIEKKEGFFKQKEVKIQVNGIKSKAKLAVKQGIVEYIDGDSNPTIEPGKYITVKVNGVLIHERTHVKDSDNISIETVESDAEKISSITVSEDSMEGYVQVEYIPQRAFEVEDSTPLHNLIVQAKVIKETYPEKFKSTDIENAIKDKKIKYGIIWENVSKVIDGGKYLIAKGKKPESPIDDEIKYYFNTEEEKKPIEVDGKVDYYNIGDIEFIDAGKTLAIKEDGREGMPGYDIYGNIIQPIKRNVKRLLKGPGCEIAGNGNRLIASIKGMPSIKGEAVCVYPVHTISTDVDIRTGNASFEGDIVIKGSVREGMKVHSGNNLNIFGDVAEAVLTAGGNIKIGKNIIASTVKAGDRQMNEMDAIEYLTKILNLNKMLLDNYHDLKLKGKLPDNITLNKLFKFLLESKFQTEKNILIQGNNFFKKNIAGNSLSVWNNAFEIFNSIDSGIFFDVPKLTECNNQLQKYIDQYNIQMMPADLIVQYCQNSNLYATNNVEVKGKGCYNTNIISENKVIFTGYPGVFRGGQIYAKKGIVMKEVGSSAGVASVLKVSKDGVIEANIAYQNTILCVEEQMYKIENPVRMLKAYMSKGEIIVDKLKL